MRCTGGATLPSGSRFSGWVLAGTSSLKTLIELPVRVVGRVHSAGLLGFEPGVESGRDQSVRALLAFGGAGGEKIGVFVLGMSGVPAHPAPLDRVRRARLDQLLPQLQVLDRSAFPLPAACLPGLDPFGAAFDEVLGVGYVDHFGALPAAADPLERRDRAGQGHFLIRGVL